MSRPVENHLKTVSGVSFFRVLNDCILTLIRGKKGGENLEFANKIEVTNQINPQCLEVFEQLKLRRKHRFLIFKLGAEEIEGLLFTIYLKHSPNAFV